MTSLHETRDGEFNAASGVAFFLFATGLTTTIVFGYGATMGIGVGIAVGALWLSIYLIAKILTGDTIGM